MDPHQQIVFEMECQMARGNKISAIGTESDVVLHNDANAIRLGNSILGNKRTTSMEVGFMSGLTEEGVEAFAHGLVRSNIETLDITQPVHRRLPHNLLKVVLTAAVEAGRNLNLKLLLDEMDAILLGQVLGGGSDGEESGLVVVENLSLHLGHIKVKGAQALAAGIRNSSNMEQLKICGCSTPASALSTFNEVMRTLYVQGVKQSPSLKALCLHHGVGDMNDLLGVLSNLRSLEIYHYSLSTSSLQLLMGRLRRDSNLVSLTLDFCCLVENDIRILAIGLRRNRTLQSLSLEGNEWIRDVGAAAFIKHLSTESSLVHLNFSNTGISVRGAILLMQESKTRNWRSLCLEGNDNIGLEELDRIVQEMKEVKLRNFKILNFRTVSWSSDDRRRAALIEALSANWYLFETDLENCVLPDSQRDLIKFYLRLNQHGRFLLAAQKDLLPTIWCYVLAKCRDKRKCRKKYGLNSMFYLLQQQPALMLAAGVQTSKRGRDDEEDDRSTKRCRDN